MDLATAGSHEVSEAGKLGELYERHAPDGVRLAYLITGDRQFAEDLVQEAFVRMFGRFLDLRRPDSFPWYLRRTIVNLARSQFRKARREREHLEREVGRIGREPGAADPGARQEMWDVLLRLPVRQRTAIVLRYYEDLSEAETADVLRCPMGTVKSLVHRGIRTLQEEVGRDG